jgi:drug/metabolite transporter (DMT)-like permease
VARVSMLLIVVFAMSLGQILFKIASQNISKPRISWETFWQLSLNPYLILGLIVYAATTVLWVIVLSNASLSKSYPFMALSMILVPLAGVALFGEKPSVSLFVGGALVVAGILVISQ